MFDPGLSKEKKMLYIISYVPHECCHEIKNLTPFIRKTHVLLTISFNDFLFQIIPILLKAIVSMNKYLNYIANNHYVIGL